MKLKSIRNRVGGGLVLLTVLASASISQAAYMAGDLILQGTLDLKNSSGAKVTNPVWYDKTTQLSFLTARTPIGSEDFELISGPVVWSNPYAFTQQTTGNLLTIGNFTMELLDSSYEANTQAFGQFINISASVIFYMDGFDPTPGDFSLTITKTTLQSQQGGSVAGFTANFTPSVYNPISVPDGGTTAVMLGGTLLGLYGVRRVLGRRATLSA